MYQLFCDTNSEIPFAWADELGLGIIRMPYTIGGKEYLYDLGRETDFKAFFDRVRKGEMPQTQGLNEQNYSDAFRPYLEQGQDILMISFSEALSSTHQFLEKARQALLEEFPQRRFEVVNTLSISMGAGLLVLKAARLWKDGADIDTVKRWVEENRQHSQAWFTVDDLNHLKRGARLSAAAATMGTLLDLKPVLTVSREGKLVVSQKVKGRKRALRALADAFDAYAQNPEEEVVSILHADAIEDARLLADMLQEKHKIETLRIDFVGPVVGTHCGPGTIGLCFMGTERKN